MPLEQMLRKVEARSELAPGDRQALLALPFTRRTLEASSYIIRQGERPESSCLLLSGFAYRQKLTDGGARQILSVNIPGDFIDLEGALLNVADHNVQALSRCEVAIIPRRAIRELLASHARIAMAFWVDTLIDSSIFREWIVNVGRRDARTRISHLLCEFGRRLELVGLAEDYRYELPMTQEQLADATGLTAVHVNRTLRAMEQEGLISRQRRFIAIPHWEKLRDVGDFNETYLHVDQLGTERDRNGGGRVDGRRTKARGSRPDRPTG